MDEFLELRDILFVNRMSDYLAALPTSAKLVIEVQTKVELTSLVGYKTHLCVEITPQRRYLFSQQR